MKVLLTSFNVSYIHKNLALRWLYVARDKSFDVTIREFTLKQELDACINEICLKEYEVIAFSVYIWNAIMIRECIKRLLNRNPKLRIILGGPEVSFENDDWFDLGVEAIIQGEGEFTLWQYLNREADLTNVKKRKYEKGITQGKTDIAELEKLENPYFLEIDKQDISTRYLYLETSRGCPFNCSYCLSSLDRKIRYFSLAYLEQIFKQLNLFAVKQVKFLDRTFNVSEERAISIGNMLLENTQVTTFQFEIVADVLGKELIQFMLRKEAIKRFRYEVGIQSFNLKTLQGVSRTQNNERLIQVIRNLVENGVILHTDLIAGLPYEDYESFATTFQTLFELMPSELQLGELKLLKGTSLREKSVQFGIQFESLPPYNIIKNNYLSIEEMKKIHLAAIGIDKSYNKGKLHYFIQYMSQNYYQGEGMELFIEIGKVICDLGISYQVQDLFLGIHEQFQALDTRLKYILILDYYNKVRQRPPFLFQTITIQEKNRIKHILEENFFFDQKTIYSYTDIHKTYYNNKECYLLVVYSTQQEYASCYIFYLEDLTWEEL